MQDHIPGSGMFITPTKGITGISLAYVLDHSRTSLSVAIFDALSSKHSGALNEQLALSALAISHTATSQLTVSSASITDEKLTCQN
jgi:hypothetical protein